MLKAKKFLVATAFAVLFAGSAYAQNAQYVGPSDEAADGDEGILGFNELCKDTFGAGARFCTSSDILGSGSLPAPGGRQWVAPTVIGISVTSSIFVLDTTGKVATSGNISCTGWFTASNAFQGLFMEPYGGFSTIGHLEK